MIKKRDSFARCKCRWLGEIEKCMNFLKRERNAAARGAGGDGSSDSAATVTPGYGRDTRAVTLNYGSETA